MEDYNLDDGPRLFNLHFVYQPAGKMKKLFDRMDFELHNLGGDPFESFGLNIVKYGTYKFKFDRRKSDYFYSDMMAGHDFHTFNFQRVNDSGMLKVWLNKNFKFYLDFNRYTKKGNSTTSLDINRDEFEFDKPIDESSGEIAVGLDISLKGFSIVLEEKLLDYKNDFNYFLPGMSMGEATGDPAVLNYFYMYQPYDLRTWSHTARISAQPTGNLLIKAVGQYSNQDLRLSYSESAAGTTYMGSSFSQIYAGEGEFQRDIAMADLDITYLVSSKFALVAAVRYQKLEQEGEMDVYDTTMPHQFDLETLGLEAGFQYHIKPGCSFTAGVRHQSRDVDSGGHDAGSTERTGFFGNVKMRPLKSLSLTGDYQYGSFKDPFTGISPTDFHRARFTARYKGKRCFLNGSYLYKLSKNDEGDGWEGEWSQVNVRTGYYNKTLKFGAGYGLIYSKQSGDRGFVFYGQPTVWNILHEGRTNMFDAYIKVFLKKKVALGFYANYYKNDGSWELERLILKPFIRVDIAGGFMGQLAYRYIEFSESMYGYNDYIANIVEVSFGYKW